MSIASRTPILAMGKVQFTSRDILALPDRDLEILKHSLADHMGACTDGLAAEIVVGRLAPPMDVAAIDQIKIKLDIIGDKAFGWGCFCTDRSDRARWARLNERMAPDVKSRLHDLACRAFAAPREARDMIYHVEQITPFAPSNHQRMQLARLAEAIPD